MIKVEVDLNKIKSRYNKLQLLSKNSKIIPVIKNNSNGLGFKKIFDLFDKELKVDIIATSYTKESLSVKSENSRKLSWIWSIEELEYIKENNLYPKENWDKIELCCKEINQVEYCIENKIPIHLMFNIGMNRGGFILNRETIENLEKILKKYPVYIATHSPYSGKEGNKKYLLNYINLIKKLNNSKLNIIGNHMANSEVFKFCIKNNLTVPGTYCRIGEYLLLPQSKDDYLGLYSNFKISTKLSHILDIKKGENIGYNHKIANKDMKIGVISIGYYNFEKLNKVLINFKDKNGNITNYYECDILSQMHDTSIIDLSNIPFIYYNGIEVEILSSSTMELNWNTCIQRTFKLNQDLVYYEYK